MADKNNESILTSEDEESEEEEMSEDEVDSDEEEDDDDEYLDDEEEDEEGADKISFDDDVASVEGGASIDGGASIAESVSFDGGIFASDKMDDVGSVGTLDTEISMSSQITNTPFKIRNRDKRREKAIQLKQEQRKMKMKERKQRQKARREMGDSAVNVSKPITLDNQREKEDTMVGINDQEVLLEEQDDEFASYFNSTKQTPKILLTTSDRPRSFTTRFLKELQQSLPNSDVYYRRAIPLKKIIPQCVKRGYTDIIMINEDRKKPTGMLVCHLPNGPTAHFKLTNAKVRKQIKNSTNPSEHKPEIILNNFGTRLGHRVGRMFSSLYPHEPEFRGRQVVTFHNQRDFIFFRHHRYIIREGKRCGLQEIGPRFTLKLRSLQKGSFDTKYGEYEWIHKPKEMDKSRRKFHL